MRDDLPLNRFKRAIRAGETQIGLWLTLCAPYATEAAAGAGFDWLVLDMEHSPNEVPDILHHLRAAEGGTAEPVARLSWNEPVLVKRLLDIGLRTLLFPMVQNADEARKAVAATRYPPKGIRGVAALTRANRFGRAPNYFQRAGEEICVMVQVETQKALAAIEDIAAVDGVDGIFVGPADLAADHGFPNDWLRPEVWPKVLDAGRRIRAAGKAAGFLSPRESDCREAMANGFNFVAVGSDMALVARGADALVRTYKG